MSESEEFVRKNLDVTAVVKYEIYSDFQIPIVKKIVLVVIMIVLVILSIVGNVATFVVAVQRNIRPVFRTCLISLALSDLICSGSGTIRFLGALLTATPQLWNLGHKMCYILPFLDNVGPVVNSLTLLAISLDRFLSVRCIMRQLWEPGGRWCFVIALGVWIISAAIASPTIPAYHYFPALLIQVNGSQHERTNIPGYICGVLKETNAHYYLAVFCVVFLPIVAAFIWLNTFLALDIWKRRKLLPGFSEATSSDIQDTSAKYEEETHNESRVQIEKHFKQLRKKRERHHLRTLRLIILITISYMVFKLPGWVYVLIRFYSRNSKPTPWELPFVFGIISMISGILNPLLYAFVTETMDHLQEFYARVKNGCVTFCQRSIEMWSSVVIVPEQSSDDDKCVQPV